MVRTIAIISLGCAKNLVNSEQMLYLLDKAGYALAPEPEGADCVIVNTCGFIDAAKSEAIDVILQMAQLKAEGKLQKIIVTGCLTERYKGQVMDELPEVDAILGVGSFGEIVSAVEGVFAGGKPALFSDSSAPVEETPRIVSTGPGWAYLRIAEGCSNFCAFCAIPYIRGRYRSRPMEAVVAEAEGLAAHGVKELIVIAQDITRYGIDLYGRPALAELCRRLAGIAGVAWIRLHYLYPEVIDDTLIDEIAGNDKIVKYLDIPIQHIDNEILRRMNRHTTGNEIRALFAKLRARIPNLVLRTSLIAGLPGEGESEFDALCAFLRETKIERVGVFPFSPEEGTPAAAMEHVPAEEARRRADLIMDIQAGIMDAYCDSLIGTVQPVLCERFDEETGMLAGRSRMDSPDIDGQVFFTGLAHPGDIVNVRITGAEDGNLLGEEETA